jgi:hypothetical protein
MEAEMSDEHERIRQSYDEKLEEENEEEIQEEEEVDDQLEEQQRKALAYVSQSDAVIGQPGDMKGICPTCGQYAERDRDDYPNVDPAADSLAADEVAAEIREALRQPAIFYCRHEDLLSQCGNIICIHCEIDGLCEEHAKEYVER